MSTAATAAPACTRYCGKHPQERVVGVCSACLASKLSSLIYSSTGSAPENVENFRVRSPLGNSPPRSIESPSNHHHPQLQTINEEADATGQEISDAAAVGVCAEGPLGGHSLEDQVCLAFDGVHPIEEEKPIFDHDICLISEDIAPAIDEDVRSGTSHLEEGKPRVNPYLRANKPIKCKRSKSLCGLRADSLIELEQEPHALESAARTTREQSNTGAQKVTLRTLFQLDDEQKWRSRALMAPHTPESHRFSADYKPIEEDLDSGPSCCDAKPTEDDAKDVHDNDNHTHNSQRCVPSASALSSSVCPSMPSKLKHSVLLNSLLCRKTGDEKKGSGSTRKSCQGNETSHRAIFVRSLNEGGLTQASDEGGLIRATYIASESREALRRCRSKLERSVARCSVSSSGPSSPLRVSHVVDMKSERKFNDDMKSERKFNLSARVLAAELPSILRAAAETSEGTAMLRSKSESSSVSVTQMNERKEDEDLRLGGHNYAVSVGTAEVLTRLQPSKAEAKPAILLVSGYQLEEHRLAHTIANPAEKEEAPNGLFTEVRKAQDDTEVEHAEMPPSKTHANVLSIWQPQEADTTATIPVETGGNLVEAYENRFCAEAAQQEEEEEEEEAVVAGKSPDRIPAYITVSQEVPMAVGGRSFSCSSSSAKAIAGAGQQGSHKLAEEWKKGGVWEAYSNKSGQGGRKWPPSGKIAPAQSGLLRFYLTPLRASGRTRFTTTRRPPKRHFWSLVFV